MYKKQADAIIENLQKILAILHVISSSRANVLIFDLTTKILIVEWDDYQLEALLLYMLIDILP